LGSTYCGVNLRLVYSATQTGGISDLPTKKPPGVRNGINRGAIDQMLLGNHTTLHNMYGYGRDIGGGRRNG
jgi:hypothetical protein